MRCSLFDFGCHAQGAIWRWWDGLGLPIQALIVLGLLGCIVGVSWGFLSLLKRIGGWPAVGGALAVIIGLVLAVLPRKPKGKDDFTGEVEGIDAEGPFRFGVDKKKKAPTRTAPKRKPFEPPKSLIE